MQALRELSAEITCVLFGYIALWACGEMLDSKK